MEGKQGPEGDVGLEVGSTIPSQTLLQFVFEMMSFRNSLSMKVVNSTHMDKQLWSVRDAERVWPFSKSVIAAKKEIDGTRNTSSSKHACPSLMIAEISVVFTIRVYLIIIIMYYNVL